MEINPALLNDIQTLKDAIKANLAIPRPTAFNKMQLDELRYFLAVYENELQKLTQGLPIIGTEALSTAIEGTAAYTQHERFSNKNRGI